MKKASGLKSWIIVTCLAILVSGCEERNTTSSNVLWTDVMPGEDCGTRLYDTCRIAPSLKEITGDQLMDFLGGVIVESDGGVNFEVYSEHAERIELLLFNDPESSQPTMHFPMVKNPGTDVWSIFVSGIGLGQHYGYIAWGPNWTYDPRFQPGTSYGYKTDCDAQGNRFNPNKLLTDPYAKRNHRDFDWGKGQSPASGEGKNGRLSASWGAAAKSVVFKSEYNWSENESSWRDKRISGDGHKGHGVNDAIYYEVHPKGLTAQIPNTLSINDLTVNVTAQGSWKGIGEIAPYLKDLGITAVELLPVMEKPDDGGYWGYNTINFFAPEWKYASKCQDARGNPNHTLCKPNDVVDEFKWMVDQLHQNDIEVVLDVVYNHTGEGGFWQSKVANGYGYGQQAIFTDDTQVTLFSFRGLDNAAYYFTTDYKGLPGNGYYDRTGVGNMTRCNHTPFRRLILDSLHYWVEEMHVDGFRFDLASIIGIPDKNPGVEPEEWGALINQTVLQDIADDRVMQKYNVRLVAEPWNDGLYVVGKFPKSSSKDGYGWSEWNDHYRDMMRKLVNYDREEYDCNEGKCYNNVISSKQSNVDVPNLLLGTDVQYKWNGRKPYHSVNFISVHDGFTTNDVLTYESKHNECGKLNNVCCERAYDAFCQPNSGADWNASRAWCYHCDQEDCSWGDDCHDGKRTVCKGKDPGEGYCEEASREDIKRQMVRNLFALMMLSQGSPLILGGDEWMRTQYGNNNAFSDSADNEYNWYRWGEWTTRNHLKRMYDFVKNLISLRKTFKEFLAPKNYEEVVPLWYWPEGEVDNWKSGRAVAMYYPGTASTPSLFIMINMEDTAEKYFPFPEEGGEWKILMDTQRYFDTENASDENSYFRKNPDASLTQSHNIWLNNPQTTSGGYNTISRSIVVVSK